MLEVVRIMKNPETQVVSQVRKTIEWRDVLNIEEGSEDLYIELAMEDDEELCGINLGYEENIVVGNYDTLVKGWKDYKKYLEKRYEKEESN